MPQRDATSVSVGSPVADHDRRPRRSGFRAGLTVSAIVHAVLLATVSFPAAYAPSPAETRWSFHHFEVPPEIEVPPPPAAIERPPEPAVTEVAVTEPDRIVPETEPPAEASRELTPPEVSMVSDSERPSVAQADVPPMLEAADHFQRRLERNYPHSLRRHGVGGVVELRMFVDQRGEVSEAEVSRSSGHRRLDRAALDMVDDMRFLPALVRDRAVGVWVSQRICFVLLERGEEPPTPGECERRVSYSSG